MMTSLGDNNVITNDEILSEGVHPWFSHAVKISWKVSSLSKVIKNFPKTCEGLMLVRQYNQDQWSGYKSTSQRLTNGFELFKWKLVAVGDYDTQSSH